MIFTAIISSAIRLPPVPIFFTSPNLFQPAIVSPPIRVHGVRPSMCDVVVSLPIYSCVPFTLLGGDTDRQRNFRKRVSSTSPTGDIFTPPSSSSSTSHYRHVYYFHLLAYVADSDVVYIHEYAEWY